MQTKNKIQSLTPEQEAAMPEYVNKWVSIGLSTEPTDEEKGTAAIVQMYEIGGYKAPKVYWFDSPLEPILTVAKLYSQISGQTFYPAYHRVFEPALDEACYQASGQMSDELVDLVINRVCLPVKNSVYNQILDQLETQVINQMPDRIANLIQCCRYRSLPGGLSTAHVGATYDFLANAVRLDIDYEKFTGLISTAEQASIVYTFGDCAYAVRKMQKCSRDEQGRLHCEDGPAILFNDGFSVYAWHGMRLFGKEWIITDPERITAETIENENDPKIKRVMTERLAARG
jgi:hypothetical protein